MPLHVRKAVLDGIKGQRIIAGAHADGSGGVCPMVAADIHLPWQTVSESSVATAQEAARAWDRYADASGSSHAATKRQLLALTAMLEASILQESSLTDLPLSEAIAEYKGSKAGHARPAVRADIPTSGRADVPRRGAKYLGLADAYEVPAEEPPRRVRTPRIVEAPVEVPHFVEQPIADVAPPEVPMAAEVPLAAETPAPRPSRKPRRNTGERDRSAELEERGGWAWLRPFRSYDEYEETLLRALSELDSHERELEELKVR
ncbi:MAG TPA: hypothetical protein VG294_10545 [Solirubrobacteraceae bacterium]|nr:hypothetical protein [Solirubrobacteraceae bacterium]